MLFKGLFGGRTTLTKGWWRLVVFCLAGGWALLGQLQAALALDTCFAVADRHNMFVSLNKTTGKTVVIGNTGRAEIEALAFKAGTDILYAADGGDFGTINLTTGRFTLIGPIGTANGSVGSVSINDVDGLSWDSASNSLYGIQRRTADQADLLFQIDPATGLLKTGVFGGADYVPVAINRNSEDNIDDLAFHPLTGVLYGLANPGGGNGTLIIINKATGAIQEIGLLVDATNPNNPLEEMEGLSFFNDGQLYGSTGEETIDPNDRNRLYNIDPATGKATLVGSFQPPYADFEALACLTATIADDDQDGIVNAGEDSNGDNNLTNDDTDGDGLPNYADPDDDGDQVPTAAEDPNGDGNVVTDDTDGDKTPNYLDTDDDDDGVPTDKEDHNGDDNPANDDQDSDSVADHLEGGDPDGDGRRNEVDPDDDGDGIPTVDEDLNGDDNVFTDDSDDDEEFNFLDADDDGDGVPSRTEDGNQDNNPLNDDLDADGLPNYLDLNADGGGYSDKEEWSSGSLDPLQGCLNQQATCFNNDVDGDGKPNFLDLDSDNDGVPDGEETGADDNQDGIPNWLDAASTQHGLYLALISATP